ncbi:SGNH/GDSL hydrolase family protein [Porphyromonadaceae bacterium]
MENRRDFLRKLGFGAAAISVIPATATSLGQFVPSRKQIVLKEGMTILFQGDSITDAGRSRETEGVANDQAMLGKGYALLTSSKLMKQFAGLNLKIYNRGISGNKVYQLQERWQKDCLDLKPDVLSILIGVNDFWHKLTGNYDGTVEVYERDFRKLMQDTKKALPNVQLIVCEPFAINNTRAVNDKWFPEFDAYRAAAKKIATEFNAVFIPFQTMFDEAESSAPGAYWAADGVHPSLPGAELMSEAWMKAVR